MQSIKLKIILLPTTSGIGFLAFFQHLDSFLAAQVIQEENNSTGKFKNASMAHHLARRTKREKEHPMCGAAPLSPQFGAKVQIKLLYNKFQGRKVEIGYNISIFKEKGLPQDLIDEEQASILSNQEAVDKYQKVIEDLEGEIQKLKEA